MRKLEPADGAQCFRRPLVKVLFVHLIPHDFLSCSVSYLSGMVANSPKQNLLAVEVLLEPDGERDDPSSRMPLSLGVKLLTAQFDALSVHPIIQ